MTKRRMEKKNRKKRKKKKKPQNLIRDLFIYLSEARDSHTLGKVHRSTVWKRKEKGNKNLFNYRKSKKFSPEKEFLPIFVCRKLLWTEDFLTSIVCIQVWESSCKNKIIRKATYILPENNYLDPPHAQGRQCQKLG